MRNPLSEVEVSLQFNVNCAALAKEADPNRIAPRIEKSRRNKAALLFSTAHLLWKMPRYRNGALSSVWCAIVRQPCCHISRGDLGQWLCVPCFRAVCLLRKSEFFTYIVPPTFRCLTFSSKNYSVTDKWVSNPHAMIANCIAWHSK